MKVISQESTVFIDVDDTLIMWGTPSAYDETVLLSSPYYPEDVSRLRPHKGHIKILKDRKARGSFIVVWSAGGFAWAEAVVKALGLEQYVDLVMSKPHAYIDDKKAEEFMGEHIYLPYNSGYGK